MRHTIIVTLALLALMLVMVSCRRTDKTANIPVPVFSTHRPDSARDTIRVREIYYGLLTPVEVCNIFDRL